MVSPSPPPSGEPPAAAEAASPVVANSSGGDALPFDRTPVEVPHSDQTESSPEHTSLALAPRTESREDTESDSNESNPSQFVPHYVKDYSRYVAESLESMDVDEAMAYSVGGDFEGFGQLQREIVYATGLVSGMSILDIGCGSGRLAYALRDDDVQYLGIDVVPELLAYAHRRVGRPEWRFELSLDLRVPVPDSSVQYACAFSVFTHLKHEESFVYLQDIARALRPGGRILFSFLDFAHNWAVFHNMVANVRTKKPVPLDQFMDPAALPTWARHLGLIHERTYGGSTDKFVLSKPVKMKDGRTLSGEISAGHSYCLMRKPW